MSGEVVRVDRPHSYQGEADFKEGAHAVVTLCYQPFLDSPCEQLATQRIEGVKAFPIPYRLEGDPKQVFSRPSEGLYHLNADVYMDTLDDKLYVGDFTNELGELVDGPIRGKKIRVIGLDECDNPGGGCSIEERP